MLKILITETLNQRFANVLKVQCTFMSTATELQPKQVSEKFRTNQNDPAKHTPEHIGHFYRMPPEVKKQLFLHGGLPKSFELQCKTFNETCIMVREPSVEIINHLKKYDYTRPCLKFILYGKMGSGKSLSLAHVLHYAHTSGFLLVHVPWVGNWMRRFKERSNSETKEGFIDLNLDAVAWLIHFKTQNGVLLNNPDMKVLKDLVWNKREITKEGSSLLELIEFGISRVKYASNCVVALAEQIKELSKSGKCRTLVAVDGYNAFFYPNTRIRTDKKEIVHPFKVTLTEAFLNLSKFDWNNSVFIGIVDENAIAKEDHKSHLPRYLLGKTGFEHVDPFVPILVPHYTQKELGSCLEYYRERLWINPYPGQDEELSFLSANNPYKLMQLCEPL